MDVVDVASLVVARNHNQNDQPQRRNPGANAVTPFAGRIRSTGTITTCQCAAYAGEEQAARLIVVRDRTSRDV